ncbi:hypothetical protein F9C11_20915 [Amycolatopsis sp. VS8301801F10]|uniref:hypothetical protein n=1 Tax=Amycolatopsis sp. VS8301801F10 TaxID=2652442 RepID=UPI0038FC6726
MAAVAALLFAFGSVLQHEAALRSTSAKGLDLRQLVPRPVWKIGQGGTALGTVLQVVALALATVAIVQPLLAGRWWSRWRSGRSATAACRPVENSWELCAPAAAWRSFWSRPDLPTAVANVCLPLLPSSSLWRWSCCWSAYAAGWVEARPVRWHAARPPVSRRVSLPSHLRGFEDVRRTRCPARPRQPPLWAALVAAVAAQLGGQQPIRGAAYRGRGRP